eukprot:gene24591-10206_t
MSADPAVKALVQLRHGFEVGSDPAVRPCQAVSLALTRLLTLISEDFVQQLLLLPDGWTDSLTAHFKIEPNPPDELMHRAVGAGRETLPTGRCTSLAREAFIWRDARPLPGRGASSMHAKKKSKGQEGWTGVVHLPPKKGPQKQEQQKQGQGSERLAGATAAQAKPDPKNIPRSVVQIISKSKRPNVIQPWLVRKGVEYGSGVVVNAKDGIVLTLASNVEFSYQVLVCVSPLDGSEVLKVPANLLAVSPDSNLALLRIDDDSKAVRGSLKQVVWAKHNEPPRSREQVVAAGVVSNSSVVEYQYSGRWLTALQLDTPINDLGFLGGGAFDSHGQPPKCYTTQNNTTPSTPPSPTPSLQLDTPINDLGFLGGGARIQPPLDTPINDLGFLGGGAFDSHGSCLGAQVGETGSWQLTIASFDSAFDDEDFEDDGDMARRGQSPSVSQSGFRDELLQTLPLDQYFASKHSSDILALHVKRASSQELVELHGRFDSVPPLVPTYPTIDQPHIYSSSWPYNNLHGMAVKFSPPEHLVVAGMILVDVTVPLLQTLAGPDTLVMQDRSPRSSSLEEGKTPHGGRRTQESQEQRGHQSQPTIKNLNEGGMQMKWAPKPSGLEEGRMPRGGRRTQGGQGQRGHRPQSTTKNLVDGESRTCAGVEQRGNRKGGLGRRLESRTCAGVEQRDNRKGGLGRRLESRTCAGIEQRGNREGGLGRKLESRTCAGIQLRVNRGQRPQSNLGCLGGGGLSSRLESKTCASIQQRDNRGQRPQSHLGAIGGGGLGRRLGSQLSTAAPLDLGVGSIVQAALNDYYTYPPLDVAGADGPPDPVKRLVALVNAANPALQRQVPPGLQDAVLDCRLLLAVEGYPILSCADVLEVVESLLESADEEGQLDGPPLLRFDFADGFQAVVSADDLDWEIDI